MVNAASDKAPAGARGHRVMLTREAAEAALRRCWNGRGLPAGLGWARRAAQDWPGDGGHIGGAAASGARLHLRARLSEVAKAIQAHAPQAMGMSYELADARVEDLRAEVWKLTRVTSPGRRFCCARRRLTGLRASAWRVEGGTRD